jgi:hypothetical protein
MFTQQEANMKPKKPGSKSGSKPDDLVRSKKVKLTEEELGKVSGGMKISDIKGESQDHKHKGEIDIASLKLR